MSPFLEWVLIGWSLLATCWWTIAIWLVSRQRNGSSQRREAVAHATPRDRPLVSIFKPIAALCGDAPSPQLIAALESFVSQMDESAEMLLGIEERDGAKWQPVIERWREKFSRARL